MINNKQKYFYVFDKKEADDIGYIANRKYFAFTDDDGKEVYSFVKDDNITMAYRMLKVMKENINKQQ